VFVKQLFLLFTKCVDLLSKTLNKHGESEVAFDCIFEVLTEL
jgi:hypothetical protein